jgi:hypothetical protein
MTTTPIVLLAPASGMTFVAMPSGATYTADRDGIVKIVNGSIADQLALIAAGCTTLEPNTGGIVTPQTGTSYTVQPTDANNTLMFTASSPIAVTLPNTLPMGFTAALYQGGAGQVMAQIAAGGSIVTPNVAATPGQYCYLYCIVLANPDGASAQWDVICQPSQTGGGVVGASTLASLYAQDAAASSGAGYAEYTIAQVFSDATAGNNGFWLKTGTGTGSGNWTQQNTITLASVAASIAVETGRAEGVEDSLQSLALDIICPDENSYVGGEFDGNGGALLGLLPGGGVVGLLNTQQNPPQEDIAWPDDISTIEGDIAFSDPNNNLLFPVPSSVITAAAIAAASSAVAAATGALPNNDFVWPDDTAYIPGDVCFADPNDRLLNYAMEPNSFNGWNTYADPTSSGYITAISPAQAVFPIVSARGANASTPAASIANCDSRPDLYGILRWIDNGTADGIAIRPSGYFTPPVEFRQFNFLGAASVMALTGITKIVFTPMIGQSLSNGTTATAFTTTNVCPRAFMFNGGPLPYQDYAVDYPQPGALCQDSQLQSLVPLVEINKVGGNGETYGGGISYWLGQGSNLESTSAFVYATLGQGGASYFYGAMQQYDGVYSNSMFASAIRCIEILAAWCKLNGIALEVPCIIHDQGENDYPVNSPITGADYYADLVANQAAYETAINAVFTKHGLTNAGPSGTYARIPFLCIQPSSWGFYSDATAPAMYEYVSLVTGNPGKFYLIGPQYWNANYNTSSGQHMTGLGYRQCAEYTGRAIQRLRAGLASEAVYATGVSNSGLTLTITFNTQSQLVHDTSVVSDPNGRWGIELTANGSNVALSSPTIVGMSQIQFTLASSITGMSCVLGIADVAPAGSFTDTSGPTTSARAPIHDSASDVMSTAAGGLTMVNYACAQQLSFTGA